MDGHKLKDLNDKLHDQNRSREKYYFAMIIGVVTFVLGYLVGKF